jgi:hypothetical protein
VFANRSSLLALFQASLQVDVVSFAASISAAEPGESLWQHFTESDG